MQDLIILNKHNVIIQKNDKIYQDNFENFIADYGELPKVEVKMFGHTAKLLVDITQIDYNCETEQCYLNGNAFQTYPNEMCESILNGIDTIIAAKAMREYAEITLAELKTAKIAELKAQRDTAEVEPIEYNGHLYDYDDKARDRINAAIIALELAGADATLAWTCADNTDATVTANDLRNIIAAVAVRSNTLHIAYRTAKTAVEAAESKEDLGAIVLE